MTGFFEEIKRRKVYRVAVAYVIAAGGIIQIASAVLPAWELPNWVLRLVIVLLLIGFPIALILAWAYDVTPAGIRVTEPAPTSHRRSRRNLLILLTAGVLVSAVGGFFVLPRASAHNSDKSIAVLPFQNLSDDRDNAYFADGIQDDILTNLAKIGDLKVISRTSVMAYRGKTAGVREIAKALGVSAVLEGSVRTDRKNNRVRVNVQLIDATNDKHLWAEDYDRDLTDVFAIQTDLAQKIASELQAKLSPSEKAQLTRKPTENGEAYLAFVQANNLHNSVEDLDKLKQAEQLYARALELDPNFALAMARYSHLESWLVHSFNDPTAARRQKAHALAEKALHLQPDLPEAHLAMAAVYYYCDQNYDAAEAELAVAQRGLPNNPEVYLSLGAIQRRRGQWAQSTANMEKAVALDPNSAWSLQNLFFNYQMTRDFPAARRTVDRALQIDPNSWELWALKAKLALAENGDFSVFQEAKGKFAPESLDGQHRDEMQSDFADFDLLKRDWTAALRDADSISAAADRSSKLTALKHMFTGIAKMELGDAAGGREALLLAKTRAERALSEAPQEPWGHTHLATVLALLGEKEAAVAEAKRAMELKPESKDAFEGPEITETLARVYAISGDAGAATGILQRLLSRPSNVTIALLKVNPVWDRIRGDPLFAELLRKEGASS